MINFRNFFEAYENGFINQFGSTKGALVEIFKNPTKKEIKSVMGEYDDDIGIFLTTEDVYIFDREKSLHFQVRNNIPKFSDALACHGYIFNTNSIDILVTDDNRNTNWNHNPITKNFILTHKNLNKIFTVGDIKYYDESIVGPWESITNNDEF